MQSVSCPLRTCNNGEEKKLTVVHLQDAVSTRDFREFVANCDGVSLVAFSIPFDADDRVFVYVLASLVRNTRGCHVVPAGVVRVDGAVEVVPVGTGQRIFVETFLVCRGAITLVGGVADGELDVTLGSTFARRGRAGRGSVEIE